MKENLRYRCVMCRSHAIFTSFNSLLKLRRSYFACSIFCFAWSIFECFSIVLKNPPPNISTRPQFFALFKFSFATLRLFKALRPASIASLFLFQYHIPLKNTSLTFYECDIISPIIPPMINSGKAIYINPPTTIPINITGKKITIQSNFMIPQDAFKPNIKIFLKTKSYK